MQNYESVSALLQAKNEFVDALKTGDKETAKNKFNILKELYKKISGKDIQTIFSESEWGIIGDALGENILDNSEDSEKRRHLEMEDGSER